MKKTAKLIGLATVALAMACGCNDPYTQGHERPITARIKMPDGGVVTVEARKLWMATPRLVKITGNDGITYLVAPENVVVEER